MAKAKVLLTGSNGFTGRHLGAALLRSGYDVLGVGLLSDQPIGLEFPTIGCDLTQENETKKIVKEYSPDHVVHLAGISFAAETDPLSYYRVHVLGTMNLINALISAGFKSAIVASSGQVYGSANAGDPLSEELCPCPTNAYSISKLAMEHSIRATSVSDKVTIVRPFNYTGPGQNQRFLIPKLVSHFKSERKEIQLGNTDVRRDFTAISDVIDAYVKLLDAESSELTVNLCSGKSYAISEILDYLTNKTGKEVNVATDEKLKRENDVDVVIGCNKRLAAVAGWTPRSTVFDVIDEMLEA